MQENANLAASFARIKNEKEKREQKTNFCCWDFFFSHKKNENIETFSLSLSLCGSLTASLASLSFSLSHCCCEERLFDAAAAAMRLGTPHLLPARGGTRLGTSALPPLPSPLFAPPFPSSAAVAGISHGSAAAELVSRSSVTNARIGDRSMVPPSGGMSPRKRPRYGSVSVASGETIACGACGHHESSRRPTMAAL